jgi:cation diffusion facilitator family transporter
MNTSQENFKVQKIITSFIVGLFIIKLIAWYYTNSVSILTDSLDYTINVIAGFIGLYSLYLSSKPRDVNHPYGHGKAEFLSATVEGTLMLVSGFIIIYEAIDGLKNPHQLNQLDFGILLVTISGIINYLAGFYAIKTGKKNNSISLIATGKHMQTDTYSTLGIVIGLLLIQFTNYFWIDGLVAFVFAIITMVSGYKILRKSIAGIMDEADTELLVNVVSLCQRERRENWIDLHNLRIIKYGSVLHLDCHLTIPWYFNINEGHEEVKLLEDKVRGKYGETVELFIHTDGCLDFSCKVCSKKCEVRQHDFVKKIDWTVENISSNNKHRVD